eukprot:CAMPEP_0117774884 /NCGR_PEP_ID=MMETSP0947-20121206/26792_1 /TAXON_ID=44440 /ORGANISM="Chattonella subsalsa, Strain CCMP2191" /LENGTH=337 /DNA_ID=CAMNT_0005601453 /DNA_START=132 /DNA_END=1146 /DNA_ORIENTATION=-
MDEVWLEQDFFYLASQKHKGQACVRQREEEPVHREHQGEGRHVDRRGVFRIRLADFYIDTAGMSKEQKNVEKLMKKAKTQLVDAYRGDGTFDFATDRSLISGTKGHGLAYGGLNYANELRSQTLLKSLDSEAGLLCQRGQIMKSEDPTRYYSAKNRQVEGKIKTNDELKSLTMFPELVDQISQSLNKDRLAELTRSSNKTNQFPKIQTLREQKAVAERPKTTALLKHYVKTGTFQGYRPEDQGRKSAVESSLEALRRNPGHFAHLHELGGRCGMCRLWIAKGCLCDVDRAVQDKLREDLNDDNGSETSEPLLKINTSMSNLSQTRRSQHCHSFKKKY